VHSFHSSRLIVIRHVEIGTHGGVQCDVVQQLPEVSKCIAIQDRQIRSQPARVSLSDGGTAADENRMQCEGDPLLSGSSPYSALVKNLV
jgi:hypothetical protein